MSRDPIDEEGGLNLYGFVWNRPTSFIDVNGLSAFLPKFLRIVPRLADWYQTEFYPDPPPESHPVYTSVYKVSRGATSIVDLSSDWTEQGTSHYPGEECEEGTPPDFWIHLDSGMFSTQERHLSAESEAAFFGSYHYVKPPENITTKITLRSIIRDEYECVCYDQDDNLWHWVWTSTRTIGELPVTKETQRVQSQKVQLRKSELKHPFYPDKSGYDEYGIPDTSTDELHNRHRNYKNIPNVTRWGSA